MMTRKLSVTLLTFFISVPAFSKSVIESEFELKLPRRFQQGLIDEKWKTLVNREFQGNWQFPDQRIVSQDIPVDIKGISVQVKSHLEKPALADGQTSVDLKSRNLQAELLIQEVSVDHMIERNVGGIIGRFRVQAHCKDIHMTLKPGQGALTLRLKPQVNSSQAGATVEDVDLFWNAGGWVMGQVNCEGVQGFDSLLLGEVHKILADSQAFVSPQKALLKKYVSDYLAGVSFDFSQSRKLVVARPDIAVMMVVREYLDQGPAGALVRGVFEISFDRVEDEHRQVLKLSENSADVSSGQATLRLPADFIKAVLSEAYRANTWIHRISSKKLPGFSSVMGSRFIQFFIWPELMKFSKSSTFMFDVYSNKDVGVSGRGAEYLVSSQMYARMEAPKADGWIPFMNFSLPFKSKVQIQVVKGVASARLVSPTLGMTAAYDPDYIKKYSPSRRFALSTIRERIADSLYGSKMDMKIPAIPVAEGMELNVEKLGFDAEGDLLLDLAP